MNANQTTPNEPAEEEVLTEEQIRDFIVAAHGNSLRALVMELDRLSKEEVLELNIPTGVPLLYEFDERGTVLSHRYL